MGKQLAQACQVSSQTCNAEERLRISTINLEEKSKSHIAPLNRPLTSTVAFAFKETLIPVGIRNSDSHSGWETRLLPGPGLGGGWGIPSMCHKGQHLPLPSSMSWFSCRGSQKPRIQPFSNLTPPLDHQFAGQ